MEIVLIIVGIFVVLLVFGGIDNNRPVESWSDEKLQRMHGKLLHAAGTAQNAGNIQQAKERIEKANEVEIEIRKRMERNSINQKVNEIVNIANSDMGAVLADIGLKMGDIYFAAQRKLNVSQEESYKIIDQEVIETEKKYRAKGYDEDNSTIKAIYELHEKYKQFM